MKTNFEISLQRFASIPLDLLIMQMFHLHMMMKVCYYDLVDARGGW